METGGTSEGRAHRARVGAAACFLFAGAVSASWASRVPAIKDGLGLSEGQFAVALLGLEAGAVLGLQLGGLVVPRTGSCRALVASLVVFSCALPLLALSPSLLVLAMSLFSFAALNSVADVAMNAQGVAVQRLMERPVLSGLHAMHSLGGVLGAGGGVLAAHLGAAPSPHFLLAAAVAAVAGLATRPLLLPSRIDAEDKSSEDGATNTSGLWRWFGGWTAPIVLLGVLAFCFTLAEGAGLNWSAVYIADSLGGTEALGAIGLGIFLGAVTLGRSVGDRLVYRFGSVGVFRRGRWWPERGSVALCWRTPRRPVSPGSGCWGRGSLTRCRWPSARGQRSRRDVGHGRRAGFHPRLPGILRWSRAGRGPGEPVQPAPGAGAAGPARPGDGLRGEGGPAGGIKCMSGNG